MRWTFDANCRALYVHVRDLDIDRQVELPDGTVADVSADGQLVGLEVLDPRPASVDLADLVQRFSLDAHETGTLASILYSPVVAIGAHGHGRPEASSDVATESEPAEALDLLPA
jgi:uncharacterized protein YuzE